MSLICTAVPVATISLRIMKKDLLLFKDPSRRFDCGYGGDGLLSLQTCTVSLQKQRRCIGCKSFVSKTFHTNEASQSKDGQERCTGNLRVCPGQRSSALQCLDRCSGRVPATLPINGQLP